MRLATDVQREKGRTAAVLSRSAFERDASRPKSPNHDALVAAAAGLRHSRGPLKIFVEPLLMWFAQNARDLPWRRTRDPYAIWVSEIMLQQTQVKTVVPYWERWMRAVRDVASLARVRTQTIHKLWEGLGYYTRVRNMQKAARVIMAEHGGKFPREFEAVLALPGIGRYTAGAICSIAFNQPTPILDGNVMRVLCRWFGLDGDPRGKETNARLWGLAEELVRGAEPLNELKALNKFNGSQELRGLHGYMGEKRASRDSRNRVSQFNQALMELGALVCTPREPRCGSCPIAKVCVAHRDGRVRELPALGKRPQVTQRRFVAFVAENCGRVLVRQRPAGVVNAHLWEFPNVEIGVNGRSADGPRPQRLQRLAPGQNLDGLSAFAAAADGDRPRSGSATTERHIRRLAQSVLGIPGLAMSPFCAIKHSITRYRITLEAFRVSGKFARTWNGGNERWVKRDKLEKLAFTSAHRKILARFRSEIGTQSAHIA